MDKIAMASPQGSQSQQLRLELHFSSGPWAVFDSAICQAQQQHQVHSSNTKCTAATPSAQQQHRAEDY